MKQAGITRRIDDLGRIVIPKEIRKSMHIKKGELLEIYLNDANSIILKRHSVIDKKYDFLKIYMKSLSKNTNSNIYVTDLNKIIFSSDNKHLNEPLSDEFESIMLSMHSANNLKEIKITDNLKILSPFKIYPIYPNGDLAGFIILEYNNAPTSQDNLLCDFMAKTITNFFEAE